MYFSSTLMWNSSLEEVLKKAYKEGFEGVEFWAQHFEKRKYSKKEYRELMKSYPIKAVVHAYSWDLNIASINEGVRKASIEEIFKSIDLAKDILAEEVTLHPGRETIKGFRELHKELLLDALIKIINYSNQKGIRISLEIMEKIPKELITSDIELKDILKELYKNMYYTLDVAHCSCEEEFKSYLNSIDNISKIHISNKIGSKLHVPLNAGDYDFSKLIFELKEKALVIEGFDKSGDLEVLNNNINYIRSIKEEFLCQR